MSSIGSMQSASDIQMDYMRLLTEQLKNQNPMEPMDNQEMASQLAQFSSLQQLENINGTFKDVLSAVQFSYGDSIIGKEVSFLGQSDQGNTEVKTGTVEGVFKDVEDQGEMKAVIDGQTVALEHIVGING